MAIPFLSNQSASEKRLSRRKGAAVKSGTGRSPHYIVSSGMKSQTRSSRSISGRPFTPSPCSPVYSDNSILYSSPLALQAPHGRRNSSHLPSRNATFDSEITQVEVNLHSAIETVAVSLKGEMAGPSQGPKAQLDEANEKGSAQDVVNFGELVEYDAPTVGSVSHPSFHASMDNLNTSVATCLHSGRPAATEKTPNVLYFKRRRRTSSTMSSSTLFMGDPSSSNSSLTTLDWCENEDKRCSSPFELPSPTISPHMPPREELVLNSSDHMVSVLPPPRSPPLNGDDSKTRIDHTLYPIRIPETFDEQPTAGPSKTLRRSKSLNSNFKFWAGETEGDDVVPTLFHQNMTDATPSTKASFRTPSRPAVPAIFTAVPSDPAHDRPASAVSTPRVYVGNISTRRTNSNLRALWRVLKSKVAPRRGGRSPVVERRPRPSQSSRGLRQRWKSSPFARLFQRVTARSVPTTMIGSSSSSTAAPTHSRSVRGMSINEEMPMQVYRRNTRNWRKNKTRGPPKSSAVIFGSRENLKRFIEYPKD